MFSGLCVHPPRKGQLLGSGSHFSVFLSSFLLHLSLLSAASISSSHPDYSHQFTNISSNKTFPGPMSPFSYHTNPLLLDSTILERTAFFIFFIAISNLSSFLLFLLQFHWNCLAQLISGSIFQNTMAALLSQSRYLNSFLHNWVRLEILSWFLLPHMLLLLSLTDWLLHLLLLELQILFRLSLNASLILSP